MQINIDGRWDKDEHGRTPHLRVVYLGDSTKEPHTPNGSTWNREGYFDHRNISFVGKPFPLEEADDLFSRLKKPAELFVSDFPYPRAFTVEAPYGKYEAK